MIQLNSVNLLADGFEENMQHLKDNDYNTKMKRKRNNN
jgi:hypothetical protein